jgi:hypothetical protein
MKLPWATLTSLVGVLSFLVVGRAAAQTMTGKSVEEGNTQLADPSLLQQPRSIPKPINGNIFGD